LIPKEKQLLHKSLPGPCRTNCFWLGYQSIPHSEQAGNTSSQSKKCTFAPRKVNATASRPSIVATGYCAPRLVAIRISGPLFAASRAAAHSLLSVDTILTQSRNLDWRFFKYHLPNRFKSNERAMSCFKKVLNSRCSLPVFGNPGDSFKQIWYLRFPHQILQCFFWRQSPDVSWCRQYLVDCSCNLFWLLVIKSSSYAIMINIRSYRGEIRSY